MSQPGKTGPGKTGPRKAEPGKTESKHRQPSEAQPKQGASKGAPQQGAQPKGAAPRVPQPRSADYHWRGRPDRCTKALLEQTSVLDVDLLARLEARFAAGVEGSQRQFQVLVGPAGIGKSHAAALLCARLQERCGEALLIRRLPAHLVLGGDLDGALRWLLQSLEGYVPARASQMSAELEPGEALDECLDRPLLLVVEDLERWLVGLREAGQRQLRALLQQGGQLQILATAREVPEALRSQDRPFFGFFGVSTLNELELSAVLQLLQGLCRAQGERGLARELGLKEHRPALSALQQILGGRPGRYVGLLREREDLVQPGRMLLRAMENRERKFRHQCQLLSRQQALILAWLAQENRAFAVKDCARALGLAEQSASPQLRALRKAGHVRATVLGRETWYEIADPLCGLDPDWALAWLAELRELAAGTALASLSGPRAAQLREAMAAEDPRARLRLPLLLRQQLEVLSPEPEVA